MSTWEIEHFDNPAGTGTGDRRTLAAWGFASINLTQRNWARGELVLTLASGTAFTDNPVFAFEDKVVLWRDGVRVWHGWHVTPARELTAPAESIAYHFADAWYWLDKLTYDPAAWVIGDVVRETRSVVRPDGSTFSWLVMTGYNTTLPGGGVVFTPWDDASDLTVQGQIRRAVASASAQGAPIVLGSVVVDMPAPAQPEKNLTCGARVQSAARYVPYSAGWWDQSQSVPVFHCAARADLPAYSHSLGAPTEAAGIAPLYDQQCHSVLIRYRWGTAPFEYIDDFSEEVSHPPRSRALTIHVESPSADAATKARYLYIAEKLLAPLYPLAWAGGLQLHNAGTALPWYLPGNTINLTGGRAEWASMEAIVQTVSHRVTAETADTCAIELGAPQHLGIQDWLELSDAAYESADAVSHSDNGGQEPPPRPPPSPIPGTLNDLNGGGTGGAAPVGTIAVETIGGTCELCGHSEFVLPGTSRSQSGGYEWVGEPITASTPPRKYKRYAGAGTIDIVLYDYANGACGPNPTGTAEVVAVGAEVYAPSGPTCGGLSQNDLAGQYNGGNRVETYTRTTLAITVETPGCYPLQWWQGAVLSGSQSYQRTEEDIEDDAYLRRRAVESWGRTATTAVWTARTTGFVFVRRALRFRTERVVGSGESAVTYTTLTGLVYWQRYRIRAVLERCPVAADETPTGAWEEAGTVYSAGFTTDIDGVGGVDWSTEIEAERGYAYRLSSASGVEQY